MALTDNLVAWYELGEASGTRADSHSTNDLTDNNTVTQAVGKVGNAAEFAPANDEYLNVADTGQFEVPTSGDLTVCAWIYTTSLSAENAIFDKWSGAAANREWRLYISTGGAATFGVRQADGTQRFATKSTISTSTWYFLTAWTDNTGNNIYIDIDDSGSPGSASLTDDVNQAGTKPDFVISRPDGTGEMAGRIDQAGVWLRMLTSGERTELYNSGNGVAYSDISSSTINCALGTLTLAGQASTVTPGSVTVSAALGTATLAGLSATVTAGAVTISAALGSLTLAGQAATVTPGAATVTVALGTLTLAGQSATVAPGSIAVTAALGTLTLAGQSASISSVVTISANLGTLTLAGQAITITPGAATVVAALGSLVFAGLSGTIFTGTYTPLERTGDVEIRLSATGDVAVRMSATGDADL